MALVVVCLIWGSAALAILALTQRWAAKRRVLERLHRPADEDEERRLLAGRDGEPRFLAGWLFRAGYRAPGAAALFLCLNVLLVGVGLLGVWAAFRSGHVDRMVGYVSDIPGVVGELLGTLLGAVPWIVFAVLVLLPWLAVRDARTKRVLHVEQDLPLVLDLLATLGEAGLGFDAALARILDAQPPQRVLTQEFRTFQVELLAGRPRVQCLRRLARRVDVTSLTLFTSALVQAEQVGSGVAEVLRRQADDGRDRRRERALTLASALPVKLLFPLVICFLPGIFVYTLGPVASQFLQKASAFIPTPSGDVKGTR